MLGNLKLSTINLDVLIILHAILVETILASPRLSNNGHHVGTKGTIWYESLE